MKTFKRITTLLLATLFAATLAITPLTSSAKTESNDKWTVNTEAENAVITYGDGNSVTVSGVETKAIGQGDVTKIVSKEQTAIDGYKVTVNCQASYFAFLLTTNPEIYEAPSVWQMKSDSSKGNERYGMITTNQVKGEHTFQEVILDYLDLGWMQYPGTKDDGVYDCAFFGVIHDGCYWDGDNNQITDLGLKVGEDINIEMINHYDEEEDDFFFGISLNGTAIYPRTGDYNEQVYKNFTAIFASEGNITVKNQAVAEGEPIPVVTPKDVENDMWSLHTDAENAALVINDDNSVTVTGTQEGNVTKAMAKEKTVLDGAGFVFNSTSKVFAVMLTTNPSVYESVDAWARKESPDVLGEERFGMIESWWDTFDKNEHSYQEVFLDYLDMGWYQFPGTKDDGIYDCVVYTIIHDGNFWDTRNNQITDLNLKMGEDIDFKVKNGKDEDGDDVFGFVANGTFVSARVNGFENQKGKDFTIIVGTEGDFTLKNIVIVEEPYTYENKTLTINTNVDMPAYSTDNPAPWAEYASECENIVITSKVKNISSNAFVNFTSLKSIKVERDDSGKKALTEIASTAFVNCSLSTTNPDIFEVNKDYVCISGTLTLNLQGEMPAYSDANPAPWAYYAARCEKLVIGASVKNISSNAFVNFTNLANITNNSTALTEIASDAFVNSSLSITNTKAYEITKNYRYENINGKNTLTVTVVGAMTNYPRPNTAPWNKYALKIDAIVISNKTTTIGDNAFAGLTRATSITFEKANSNGGSVTSIGKLAFYQCVGLTSIVLDKNVATVGENAFASCNRLATLTILNNKIILKGNIGLSKTVTTIVCQKGSKAHIYATAYGLKVQFNQTGSVFTDTNFWVVTGGSIIVLAAIIFTFVSVKKKKKAALAGAPESEE